MNPKDRIAGLRNRVESLRAQAEREINSANSPVNPALGELALKAFVPHGYKGAARNIGKKVSRSSKDAINQKWRYAGVQHAKDCKDVVREISIRTKTLTNTGNSQRLATKFNRLNRIKNPLTYLDSLESILSEIENLDLIWNKDIPAELKEKRRYAEEERRRKAILRTEAKAIVDNAKLVNLYDREPIILKLKIYPRVQKSIVAAFDRLQDVTLEAERHCIVSCRTAIEQLCSDATGEKDWKKGLNTIYSSDTDRKHIKGVWNYLSNKGGHGFHDPSKKEAEYGLKIAIAAIEAVLEGDFIYNRK